VPGLVLQMVAGSFLAFAAVAGVAGEVEAESDSEPEAGKTLALIGVGEVDDELLLHIEAFVEKHSALPVRILPPRRVGGSNLRAVASKLAGERAAGDVCLVGVVTTVDNSDKHTLYAYEKRVGIVNARVLKTEDCDDECYRRRLDRLAMRSYALLLGATLVPIPQSCLYPYTDLEELDRIGRTLDPPSLYQVQNAAMEQGVRLVEDSVFYREK